MRSTLKVASLAIISIFFTHFELNQDALAMQENTLNIGGAGEGFGITQLGGHNYGSNNIGIWLSGNTRIGLSDTIVDKTFSGIGIFDARLSKSDLEQAAHLHEQLCEATRNGPAHEVRAVEPSTTFYVSCTINGKSERLVGRTYDLPEKLFISVSDFFSGVRRDYLSDARAIVKLEAQVASVERKNDGFLISIRFMNRAELPIEFPRLDYLDPRLADQLDVQGSSVNGDIFWEINLAGIPLANEQEAGGESVTTADGRQVKYVKLGPRSAIDFNFYVRPNVKVPKGTYTFNLVAAMDANAPDVAPSLGFVDFHSDYKNPYRVTFDRDYPSTPQEWKEFESRKAKEVSALPSGAMVAESGYYRMVSIFGPRSQFVTKLDAGTAAPKLDVNNWDKWEWEADLARSTICKPADACTRDGTWVLRRMEYVPKPTDETIASYTRRVRMGEAFPALNVADASKLYWEWLGA